MTLRAVTEITFPAIISASDGERYVLSSFAIHAPYRDPMGTGPKVSEAYGEKMVLLSDEEHNFLFNLLLDHGTKVAGTHPSWRDVRNTLVQKLSRPHRVRDVGAKSNERPLEQWVRDEDTASDTTTRTLAPLARRPA